MPFSAIAVLLVCNVLWALNVVVSKLAVDDLAMPPLFYAALRSLLVVIALAPLLRRVPSSLPRVLLIGLAISGGSFSLLFIGLQTASPSAAGIVSLTGAPLTVLFAILFLKEQVRWRRGLGIALTFAGVVIAIGSPSGLESGWGLAYVFAGAVIGAAGSVFFKRIDIGAVEMQAWAGLASVCVLFPLSFTLETGQIEAVSAAPLAIAGCVLFAGLIVSVGAHSSYYRLFQRHDANLVVPFTLLTPLLTIGFGAWLTGDPIGWTLIAGGALAVCGVAIIVLRPSTKLFKPLLVRPRI
ncbi:DMT family transporter [Erythrobacter aurantius]|uniref:DMT family transporter n=1 Tax=Erythrobacter aurantius TaxID=2909249 RepID=UPI00207A8E1A|nr:DMT family transporter [Erythrobacter aurantius]